MIFDDIYQDSIYFRLLGVLIGIAVSLLLIPWKKVASRFNSVKGSAWALLGLIFLIGALLRLVVFPHTHLMYIDEPYYLEAAKNFNEQGRPLICDHDLQGNDLCRTVPKPPGWPFLISLAFKAFGADSLVALYLSSILGALSILLVFLFAYLAFKDEKTALWASLFLALAPLMVIWSVSAETNMPSLFFFLLSIIAMELLIDWEGKKGRFALALIFSLSVIFAISVRLENVLLLAILAYAMITLSKKKHGAITVLRRHRGWIQLAMLGILAASQLVLVPLIRPSFPILFPEIYLGNLSLLLREATLDYLLLIPLIGGLVAWRSKSLSPRSEAFALAPLLLLFVFFLPLYSESRMALLPCLFLIIISAYLMERGISRLVFPWAARLSALLLLCGLMTGMLAADYGGFVQQHQNKILETQAVRWIDENVPSSCLVIMKWPTVLHSVSDNPGIKTGDALENQEVIEEIVRSGGCLYYFEDGYCVQRAISPTRLAKRECAMMPDAFTLEHARSFRDGKLEYRLFRLTPREES